jgi:hypothetical protein
LKVPENRALRRIFGPKKEEVAGGQKVLHEKRHNMLFSPDIIRAMKMRRARLVEHVTPRWIDDMFTQNLP